MTKSKQHRLNTLSTEGHDCAQTLQRGLSERHIQLIGSFALAAGLADPGAAMPVQYAVGEDVW